MRLPGLRQASAWVDGAAGAEVRGCPMAAHAAVAKTIRETRGIERISFLRGQVDGAGWSCSQCERLFAL
jgi:hypothetical protein